MSLTPQRPDETADVADLKNRVRILEANDPTGAGLIVSDGSSSNVVNPTTELLIGEGLELHQIGSSGEAEIELVGVESYTPTLVGSGGTNPTIGAGGQISGRLHPAAKLRPDLGRGQLRHVAGVRNRRAGSSACRRSSSERPGTRSARRSS